MSANFPPQNLQTVDNKTEVTDNVISIAAQFFTAVISSSGASAVSGKLVVKTITDCVCAAEAIIEISNQRKNNRIDWKVNVKSVEDSRNIAFTEESEKRLRR